MSLRCSRNPNAVNTQSETSKAPTLLETLTEGDRNLDDALGYYLLVDPKTQIPFLGSPGSHHQNGIRYKDMGNRDLARYELELAARIEISRLNVKKAEEYMVLADCDSDSPEQMTRHRTIMMHLDEVKDIVAKYYGVEKYDCYDRSAKIPIELVLP